MAYNSLKSYWIWRRKKEAEENAWRELGVDENIIAELREFDRIAYNSDDRFYKLIRFQMWKTLFQHLTGRIFCIQ